MNASLESFLSISTEYLHRLSLFFLPEISICCDLSDTQSPSISLFLAFSHCFSYSLTNTSSPVAVQCVHYFLHCWHLLPQFCFYYCCDSSHGPAVMMFPHVTLCFLNLAHTNCPTLLRKKKKKKLTLWGAYMVSTEKIIICRRGGIEVRAWKVCLVLRVQEGQNTKGGED